MKRLIAIIIIASSTIGIATAQQTLYTKLETVNIYAEPNAKAEVILILGKDHQLMAINRKAFWVEVGVAGTGKIGWASKRSTTASRPAKVITTIVPPSYETFAQNFSTVMLLMKQQGNRRPFRNPRYKGDGIVTIEATDTWTNLSRQGQKKAAKIILDIWAEADGTGLGVWIHVVDTRGTTLAEYGGR